GGWVCVAAGEECAVVGPRRTAHTVVAALEHDRGYGDGRLLREQVLQLLVPGIAVDEPVPVSVRVDDDLDEVGVVQAGRAARERRGGRGPRRRPHAPQEPAELVAAAVEP